MTPTVKSCAGGADPAAIPAPHLPSGAKPCSGAADHDVSAAPAPASTAPRPTVAVPGDVRAPSDGHTPSAPTILVVDDHPTNLKLVSDVLEYAGYRVLQAADAEAAQVVLADTQPDLIFMDLALPGMDGLTLTRKLKAGPLTRHIRVIALTAFAMKGDDQKARAAGCDGYISKPIDTRNFPAQAAEFLRRPPNLTSRPV